MNERHALLTEPGAQPRLYRRLALSTEHIDRFVAILLRELLDGGLYDAVHVALRASGIEPLPSSQCERIHFDTRVERQNASADAVLKEIESDTTFRAVVTTIVTTVLNRSTVPAPEDHLDSRELLEFMACCATTSDDVGHIQDYERYAAYHAHLGACANCDQRLQAAMETEQRLRAERATVTKGVRS